MMMGLIALLLLASVPLTRGSFRRLAQLPVRALGLLPVALFLQVLVITIWPTAPEPIPISVHLFTYLLAAVFLVRNLRITGVPLLALGGAMNGITIALNDGSLPASAAALRRAGWAVDPGTFTNSEVLAHPHLAWLGDNFAVPAGLPFANVFSLGDVVIILGALTIVQFGSRPKALPTETVPSQRSTSAPTGAPAMTRPTPIEPPIAAPVAPAVLVALAHRLS